MSIDISTELMTPAEVAQMFRVDVKTVTRWAQAGQLSSIRTPGGHRRFPRNEVEALRDGSRTTATAKPATTKPKPKAVAKTPPAPGVPVVTDQRDGLTGHTITVEALGDDAAAFGAPAGTAGRLAAVERTDGRFGTLPAIAPAGEDPAAFAEHAEAIAAVYGARFIGAEAAK